MDTAVTWLFVPGHRPERVQKALATRADVVVIDLEDAVPEVDKTDSRARLAGWTAAPGFDLARVVIRVNAYGTPWHADDVAAVVQCGAALMLPKAEPGGAIRALSDRGVPRLVALVETARGVVGAADIADVADRIALGNADLGTELGVDPSNREALSAARGQLVLCSAARSLPRPIDGITTSVTDLDRVRSDAAHSASMGFGGKLCIHPGQLVPTREAFAPREADVAWARSIIAATSGDGTGAVRVAGNMVDAPIIARASEIIQRSL